MCIICVEYQKQLINAQEARGILSEMKSSIDPEHLEELEALLEEESQD